MLSTTLPKTLQSIVTKMNGLNLRERPSQIQMLKSVYNTIQEQKILCIEAPTGTGKTLAYCLAGFSARKNNQILIISTATTALQEQFFQNDLPLVEKILDQKINTVLAKGRRRYVCHIRLFHPEQFMESLDDIKPLNDLQDALTAGSWNGEYDQLPIKIEAKLWQKISTDANGCSAGRCAYFNQCIFFQNRRKMHQADIVVTNHNLLLADLELGGGVILPELKDSIYIIDECHHLPEKALAHFAKQAAVLRSLDWLNNIGKLLTKAVAHINFKQQMSDDLHRYVKELVTTLRTVKLFLDNASNLFQDNQAHIKELSQPLIDLTQNILDHNGRILSILQHLARELEKAYEHYQTSDKTKAELVTHLQSSFNFVVERCDLLQATWHDLLTLTKEKSQPPIACWFDKTETQSDGIDYTLHTSPINVSEAIKTLFWDKLEQGVILCSATIRSMGTFNEFLRKLGLKNNPKLIEEALQSPFEYQNSVVFIPQMRNEPTLASQEQHLQEIIKLLPQLILPNSGNLILFTSRKAMWFVLKQWPDSFKKNILLQDDYSKMDLIALHKKQVDKKQCSIIFGLASFAEGIDLPGAYCQHVIIQKIPFSVPSDPISKTRADWLKKHLKDPFQLVTLPETSTKLAQYIGRLLRHEDDRGIVSILDKRLYSKNYGALLLKNFPEFTQLINYSLADFLQHELVYSLFNETVAEQ